MATAGYHETLETAVELRDRGRFRDAEASCAEALRMNPDDAEGHRVLATVLEAAGQPAEAATAVREAIRLDPTSAKLRKKLGDFLAQQGLMEEAEAAYRDALAMRPDYVAAWYVLAQLRRFQPGDPDLAGLETLAADGAARSDKEHVRLHFALAKAYEDVGDYDRAFEHLDEANRRKREGTTFDIDAMEHYFRRIADVFDSDLLQRLAGAGVPSERPIFIVGMPRSGTSLVEQILASHPSVHGADELWDVMLLTSAVAALNPEMLTFPEGVAGMRGEDLHALGSQYLRRTGELAPDAERISDKAPMNFQNLGLIKLILPQARIVHCVRDPVDTCLSCYGLLWKSSKMNFTYDLEELGRYYVGYAKLMEHWRSVLPEGFVLDMRYEDVVADLEGEARRLVEHCGLEWTDACLSFHETDRAVRSASFKQVRQPIYKTSLERWRRYERHLGPLLDVLGVAK